MTVVDRVVAVAREWLVAAASDFLNPTFVTLLFKDRVAGPQGGFILQSLDVARNEIKSVTNRVDRVIYGSAVQRYQLRVRRIPVLEQGVDRGWHCHMLIERPKWILEVRFRHIIHIEWAKSPWAAGYHMRDADLGAVNYLMKERSKEKLDNWSDSIVAEAMVLHTK